MDCAVLPCPTLMSSTKRLERAGVELCICQSTGRPPDLPLVPWQAESKELIPFVTSWAVNVRNRILSLFSHVPFPSMHLTPFPFHLPFQKSAFHNTAGRPRPEGQLQAPRGTASVYTYLPDHDMMDQTTCCACISPTSRLQVKASTRERNATELFLHFSCCVCLIFY